VQRKLHKLSDPGLASLVQVGRPSALIIAPLSSLLLLLLLTTVVRIVMASPMIGLLILPVGSSPPSPSPASPWQRSASTTTHAALLRLIPRSCGSSRGSPLPPWRSATASNEAETDIPSVAVLELPQAVEATRDAAAGGLVEVLIRVVRVQPRGTEVAVVRLAAIADHMVTARRLLGRHFTRRARRGVQPYVL